MRGLKLLLLLLVLGGGGYAAWRATRGGPEATVDMPVWTVETGDLRVSVLERGTLEALSSHTVISEVEGNASILRIVKEGTIITPADVEAGKVLVELDSSGIRETLERQRIDLADAQAARENAVATLDIQLQENASAIRQAELRVRFAHLDLERYVGKALASQMLQVVRSQQVLATEGAAEEEEMPPSSGSGGPDGGDGPAEVEDTSTPDALGVQRLIRTLLESESLEGEALQTKRQLDSDIRLAEEELRRAEVKLSWTLRLLENDYVSRDEKEADELALARRRIDLERAETASTQFVTYDFPKAVEELLSDVVEAREELSRTMKRAAAAEAVAVATLRSREEQERLQSSRVTKYEQQLAACVIRADRPGLVVYASSSRSRRRGNDDRIKEGTSIRERQEIITIPDLATIGVRLEIHESVIKRVLEGQLAFIVADALPDRTFSGIVHAVSQVPSDNDSWLNPDLKVYATEIELGEIEKGLRPGMTAQVEIEIANLDDVLLIPAQAVAGTPEVPTVFIVKDDALEERPVRLGPSNERFVQVVSGVEVGERVALAPPRRGIGEGTSDGQGGTPGRRSGGRARGE